LTKKENKKCQIKSKYGKKMSKKVNKRRRKVFEISSKFRFEIRALDPTTKEVSHKGRIFEESATTR
jgi:hypothetical protein